MYNGYGGYGGGYGMGMMGGGSEMMYVVVCCCLCLCLAAAAAGYYWYTQKGKQGSGGGDGGDGGGDGDPPMPPPPGPVTPAPPAGPSMCHESWGSTPRTDANDPRPPIRPEYCMNEPRSVGRDCYYWKVQNDPVTGRARWMRVPDSPKADSYYGGSCVPQVKCSAVIDPSTLPRYSELEPAELLNQCKGVAPTATNEADTVKMLTQQAQEVGASWTDASAWTDTHSKVWYNSVLKYVGQKDLNAYISNAVKAARALKAKFTTTTLKKSTFAYILEAAVRTPENRADWIIDIVNSFTRRALSNAQATEAFFVIYMRTIVPNMIKWETLIENPLAFGVK